jgi:hypothetical protein
LFFLKKFDENINYNFTYRNVWANRIKAIYKELGRMNDLRAITIQTHI